MDVLFFAIGLLSWSIRPKNDSEVVQKHVPNAVAISKFIFILILASILISGVFGIGFEFAIPNAKDALSVWGVIEMGIYIYLQGVAQSDL